MKTWLIIICLLIFQEAYCLPVLPNTQKAKIEQKAIAKIRHTFRIPKKVNLNAITIVHCGLETLRYDDMETSCDYSFSEFCDKLDAIDYEVYVFDDAMSNVFVYNRMRLGCGKIDKKELYSVSQNEKILISFLSEHKYVEFYGIGSAHSFIQAYTLLCLDMDNRMSLVDYEHKDIKEYIVTNNTRICDIYNHQKVDTTLKKEE